MKLYMISLGGKAKGCSVEVHDVKFAAAEHIDETIALLKAHWYGVAEKLHMDSYKVIDGADGYAVRLTREKPSNGSKLYFIQLGAYNKASTQEQHEIGLLISESEQEAKERALRELSAGDIENHVDSIVNVEDCLISTDGERYYIKLCAGPEAYDTSPDWFGYRRLDREQI